MLGRLATLVLLLGVGVAPAIVSSPSEAAVAPAATKVTARAAAARVAVGNPVRVAGRVSGRSARAVVLLQRKRGDSWVLVKRARVRADRTYAVRTKARRGANRFRVKVPRTQRLRGGTSRVVTVRGVRRTGDARLREARAVILRETNAYRDSQGLAALKPMAALNGVAQRWSVRMADTGRFEHNPDYAAQYPDGWSRAAENIAMGYSRDRVVDAWIDSPGHRANLVGAYTHLGIGVAWDRRGRPYYTQNFAAY
ncbi:CAP domain-containing protein [Nocardioides lijunqiniae]|uniref:CAP domain-containing protein n=1 Tax=Nocardioides lijunqiniae TaxID=2760832 RepID=UPI0018780E18